MEIFSNDSRIMRLIDRVALAGVVCLAIELGSHVAADDFVGNILFKVLLALIGVATLLISAIDLIEYIYARFSDREINKKIIHIQDKKAYNSFSEKQDLQTPEMRTYYESIS